MVINKVKLIAVLMASMSGLAIADTLEQRTAAIQARINVCETPECASSAFAAALAISAVVNAAAKAVSVAEESVNSLAQGCYAIQSPATGKYVTRAHRPGYLMDDGLTYSILGSSVTEAEKFYFKPTSFSQFMLYDTRDRYLAGHQPLQLSSGWYAGKYAEWRITAVGGSSGSPEYRLDNIGMNRTLRHATWDGGMFYSRLVNGEQTFKLIPAEGCHSYPEAELNATRTQQPDIDRSVSDEVVGFADVHTHLTSFQFMGGKFLHGQPFNRYGITHALNDGLGVHGSWGALDIIGNLMGHDDVNARHDTRGYPEFPSWPEQSTVSHQQAYYRWIERAHKAGLKFMVSHLVENEVLCNVQKTVNPLSWVPSNTCNTMGSVVNQRQTLTDMENYIDAQAGGPGKGFFRLVTSPAQAREVINEGKLAVLIGIETSELFNCGFKDAICTKEYIDQQLDFVYSMGVRSLFPIHRFDNQFGGTRIENGFINLGQALAKGVPFVTKECKPGIEGQVMTGGFPILGDVPVIKDIINSIGLETNYDESRRHCNRYGLTDLGTYLVNRMIDKGMLIEVDHMSYDSSDAVLKVAEARNYSGVITGHSHTQRDEYDELSDLHKRIAVLGGILSPYNVNSTALSTDIDRMASLVAQTPYHLGVGLGSDVNGLGKQALIRDDIAENPIEYPFTSFDGLYSFDRQTTGNRTFDYNNEGVAHYGLMADHIEDMRQAGTDSAYQALMKSAEAYLQMWERATSSAHGSFVDPNLGKPFSLVDQRSGKCLDIAGDDNNVRRDANIQLRSCDTKAKDQKWVYHPITGNISNLSNPRYCMDNEGSRHNGAPMKLWECVTAHPNQTFDFDGLVLKPRNNHGFAVDAYGSRNGSNIGLWQVNGQLQQSFRRQYISE